MGERLLCKQEVIGSIPFTSTTAQCAKRIARAATGATSVAPRAAQQELRRGSGEEGFAGIRAGGL